MKTPSYKEFIQLQEEIEDYEDVKDLRRARATEENASTVSLAQVKKALGA